MRRIVLTGGPGSGKTIVSAAVALQMAGRVVLVPEAATDVYARRQTRWDLVSLQEKKDIQREIFRTQLEREDAAARMYPGQSLLLDRGTVDGAAYWPDGPEAYWQDLGTTHAQQLARYDAVIWLQTAAAIGLYTGQADNPIRFEAAPEAIQAGERLLGPALWGTHPQLERVAATADVAAKIHAVSGILARLDNPRKLFQPTA